MNFKGQKVVCVKAGWNAHDSKGMLHDLVDGPEVDKIYTLDNFFHHPDGRTFFYLVEFSGHHSHMTTTGISLNPYNKPRAWIADHFRPAQTKSTETGMAILKKIALTGKLPSRKKLKEAA
jgi:hypothetical protein